MTPVIPCDFCLCLLPDFRMQRKIIIHLEIKNEKYIIPGTYCNYFSLSNKLIVHRQANSVAKWLTPHS